MSSWVLGITLRPKHLLWNFIVDWFDLEVYHSTGFMEIIKVLDSLNNYWRRLVYHFSVLLFFSWILMVCCGEVSEVSIHLLKGWMLFIGDKIKNDDVRKRCVSKEIILTHLRNAGDDITEECHTIDCIPNNNFLQEKTIFARTRKQWKGIFGLKG